MTRKRNATFRSRIRDARGNEPEMSTREIALAMGAGVL
jgi:hypothetical protein